MSEKGGATYMGYDVESAVMNEKTGKIAQYNLLKINILVCSVLTLYHFYYYFYFVDSD